ncbi:MAG: division plane positioning ATPase MipZ, partial [Alphaproteobacteria bacterium]
MSVTLPNAPVRRPRVIVLGNEKGGSGKSTAAMHLVVGLLHAGHRVGSMDVDSRQATFSRYIDNRRATAASRGVALTMTQEGGVEVAGWRGERGLAAERVREVAAVAGVGGR